MSNYEPSALVVAENLSQHWPAAAGACRNGLYCCGSPDVVKLISKWLVLGAMQVVALELVSANSPAPTFFRHDYLMVFRRCKKI